MALSAILADPQVQVILLVVGIAVVLRVGMGLAVRGFGNVNVPVILITGFIALLIGIGMVSEIIHDGFWDLTPEGQLVLIASGILTIYGSQAIFDKAKTIANSKNIRAPGPGGN